ncbi:MAG TPA: hypothetical protein VNX60_05060 [Candidatus Acidoferrum sp.]|jgi:hypothetical protein|nr:hypothetical protein [Candidatus Acidoferrum sp.]
MNGPVDVAEVYKRDTPAGGSTSLDEISGATKISGPWPSLDEQFGNGRNPFNRSAFEVNAEMQRKIQQNEISGRKKSYG